MSIISDEPLPPEEPPQEPAEQPSEPSRFALAARAFWRGLLRLVIILAILAVVVGLVYLAIPLGYRELVLPVRDTSARLQAMQTQNAVDKAGLSETLMALQTRLNQLEVDRAALAGQQAGQQTGLDSLRQDQNSLAKSLTRLDQIEMDLTNLKQMQSFSLTQVEGMRMTQNAPQSEVLGLLREVQTLKVMNLLIRAQLNLAENNFGLARTDLQNARNVLLALRDSLPGPEHPTLNPWIARLDLAINELPGSPVLAAGDLAIAYELLSGGMLPPTPTPGPGTPLGGATPGVLVEGSETVTPAPFLIGPSETPTPWISETPTPLISATPTPWVTETPTGTLTRVPTVTRTTTATATPAR